MNPVRDDSAMIACPACGLSFEPLGRQRFCGTTCRQAGWRRQHAAPVEPIVAKSDAVYECEGCGSRYLGIQRCEDCNKWWASSSDHYTVAAA